MTTVYASGPADTTRYVLRGKRQGFEIRPDDDIRHCPDGYTEVRRGGSVVGVYLTALLAGGGER